jgi:transcriptional regulator with XRE-family HTH domain
MPPASTTHRVVEDLRVALFRKGISQQAVAERTGMSQSAVSRRLSGDVPATLNDLESFAAAAGAELHIELRDAA